MAEIDDNQLRVLQGAHKLMDTLLRNPKTRQQAEALVKTVHPEVNTTADYAAPYVERADKIEKKLDDFIKRQEEAQVDAQLGKEYDTLRGAGWQDEGIEKLKKFQIERNIASPIDAAAAWEKRFPTAPQEPSIYAPSDWGFGREAEDDKMAELLWKDEDAFANKEAFRVITEFKNADKG